LLSANVKPNTAIVKMFIANLQREGLTNLSKFRPISPLSKNRKTAPFPNVPSSQSSHSK